MVKYQNEGKFFEWLKTVLKEEKATYLKYSSVREEWLKGVLVQYSDNGMTSNGMITFEVKKHFTKSHNPECYTLEVNDIEDENDDWILSFMF